MRPNDNFSRTTGKKIRTLEEYSGVLSIEKCKTSRNSRFVKEIKANLFWVICHQFLSVHQGECKYNDHNCHLSVPQFVELDLAQNQSKRQGELRISYPSSPREGWVKRSHSKPLQSKDVEKELTNGAVTS